MQHKRLDHALIDAHICALSCVVPVQGRLIGRLLVNQSAFACDTFLGFKALRRAGPDDRDVASAACAVSRRGSTAVGRPGDANPDR